MQHDLLLTAETLWLNPDLTCGKPCNGGFAIKCLSSQGYVTVNDAQAKVLNEFTTRRTVPEVLEICIRNRTCLPLHEFYDLILKAHRAGVLRAEMSPEIPAKSAVRWLIGARPNILLPIAAFSFFVAIVSLIVWLPTFPTRITDIAYGWVATGGALSLGYLLGAVALRGAGCEVYRPRLGWYYGIVPHFAVDLRDSCMSDTAGRLAINSSPLVPVALMLAVAQCLSARWTFVPALAFLIEGRPFGSATASKLLYLARRRALLATDRPELFDGGLTFGEQLRRMWQRFDVRVALLQFVVAIGWTLIVAMAVSEYVGVNILRSLADRGTTTKALIAIAIALVGVVLLWVANLLQHRVVAGIYAVGRQISIQWRRWVTHKNRQPLPLEIEAIVRQNPLLRRLDIESQDELIQHLRPLTAPAWRTVIQFEEDPPFIALIVSGTAAIYRRTKTGRRSRFLQVVEGDLFGAHRLVDRDYPSLEIRAKTPLYALVIDRDEFARIVINKFGASTVRNYVHRHLFLQRVSSLCAEWRPNSIARFAELTGTSSHAPGGKIILRGQDVMNLYVLYEGHARALRDSKPIADIDLGDVFGEISLLQSSAATADVESKDAACCLFVNRVEFIRFLTRNHHVALQVERLCSRRLGRPIFPFDSLSFEQR